MLKNLDFAEKNINRLCRKYHLRCHIAAGILFVSSETGNWRIIHSDDQVVGVFHENMRGFVSKKGKFWNGYHKQNISYTRLEDVLQYIRVHDNSAIFSYLKRNSILFFNRGWASKETS